MGSWLWDRHPFEAGTGSRHTCCPFVALRCLLGVFWAGRSVSRRELAVCCSFPRARVGNQTGTGLPSAVPSKCRSHQRTDLEISRGFIGNALKPPSAAQKRVRASKVCRVPDYQRHVNSNSPAAPHLATSNCQNGPRRWAVPCAAPRATNGRRDSRSQHSTGRAQIHQNITTAFSRLQFSSMLGCKSRLPC